MLYKSAIITNGSGSLGGITASHNAGGAYFRARTVPTDPGTPEQNEVRQLFGVLQNRWINTLTEAQREGWTTYAANVSKTNPLGDPIFVSGANWYVGNNVSRRQAGLARVDDAPSIFDIGDFTDPVYTALSEATQQVLVGFEVADDWVGEDGSAMLVFMSRPQNQTVNFWKGPYQLAGIILGNLALPPTSPATVDAPFAFVADQRIFVRTRVTRADCRLSQSVRDFELAVA